MPYKTKAENVAADLEEKKLKQRLQLVKHLKEKGIFLELFAGKGYLSQVYANYASQLILVDENEDYLREAQKKLGHIPTRIFCKDNIDFIREDLPKFQDLVFVDFDAFGCPAKQIKAFFEVYSMKPKEILVS